MNTQLSDYFIICQPGLEQILMEEIEELIQDSFFSTPIELNQTVGGIEVKMPESYIAPFHSYLKSLTRILLRLETKKCRDFPKLYKIIQKIEWHKYLAPEYKINISAKKSRLFDSSKIEDTCQSGIKKYFQGHQYKNSQLEYFKINQVESSIYIRFENDVLTVSLDLTGDRFDKRLEEKNIFSVASIRNNFAFALIKECSKYFANKDSLHFFDPFCGSGTFIYEAQNMFKKNERQYNYQHLMSADNNILISEKKNYFTSFSGSDIDEQLIKKLKNEFNVQVADALSIKSLPKNTIVITNPPYGIRIGDASGRKTSPAEFIQAFIKHYLNLENIELLSIIIPSDFSFNVDNKKFEYKRGLKFKNGGISVQQHIFYLKNSTSL